MTETTGRIEREAQFHDAAFADDVRQSTWRFYRAVGHVFGDYERRVADGAGGRRVLELGCGRGGQAFDLAAAGDAVDAIDISATAIAITETEAQARGVEVRAREMDAHHLAYDDATFDLVCGSGILHHLELERAMAEIGRVLTPGGRGVFLEPLGHNPALNAYRRRTPQLRSDDEEPLRRGHLDAIASTFATCERTYGGLLTLPLAAVDRLSTGRSMALAQRVEQRLLRGNVIGPMAWFVVLDGTTAGGTAQRT